MARPILSSVCALPLALAVGCSGSDLADSGIFRPDAAAGGADAAASTDAAAADAAAPADAGTPDSGAMDAGMTTTGPIEVPDETWTWVPFPDSQCINGSPTGIGVNIKPGSTKLIMFLMGGNACFNQASCFVTANLDGYGQAKFDGDKGGLANTPLFSRTNDDNPFKDYSYVFVPYCTGDVHAGSNPSGTVAGSAYTFMGYDNIRQFMERLVPTFPDVTEVVLSGSSAGGFGAMLNFGQVQAAFGSAVNVTLVDDSGPPMSTSYIAACLQDHFRTTWAYEDGVLADCAGCLATPDGSWIEPYFDQLMATYPDRNFAVISSDGDDVIRGFWGFGQNNCANIGDFLPPAYPASMYRAGLEDFRDNVAMGQDNVGLFMITGSSRHVFLAPDSISAISQDGVTLSDWLQQAIADDETWTHVPAP